MKLFIKNMVSLRCKMIVKSALKNQGLHYTSVELGEVEIKENISAEKFEDLKVALLRYGLELMDDKRITLIEKTKKIIIEMVHYTDELPRVNFSDYLSEKINHDYTQLSKIFSEVKGTTIENFIIAHKIERVKELLVYNELTLKEIAGKLHYSSTAHLCNQFKKVTGLTPSFFKKMKRKRFIAIKKLKKGI